MDGITRYEITDLWTGEGAHRVTDSRTYWSVANSLYRKVFADLGVPLFEGNATVKCTKAEFEAGYDYQLGIDVVLAGAGLGQATLQEKFLFTGFDTLTIEHCQDWLNLIRGDWYNMKAQYYFCGYDKWQQTGNLDPWVLVDLARLRRATGQRRVEWHLRGDYTERARASFMYCDFSKLPSDVLVASSSRTYSLY